MRRAALALWFLLPAAALLVFFHTGERAEDLCGDQGFASGGISLWPPGSECFGGEPTIEATRFDFAVAMVLVAFVWPLQGLILWAAADRRVRRSRRAPNAASEGQHWDSQR